MMRGEKRTQMLLVLERIPKYVVLLLLHVLRLQYSQVATFQQFLHLFKVGHECAAFCLDF